mmetsp:Transcript_13795/g.39067  ORF Transcript_13795/g.39067 Transcript_13795/m.39067 type:complete len:132 (-) Transcript_13795:303-698(-)
MVKLLDTHVDTNGDCINLAKELQERGIICPALLAKHPGLTGALLQAGHASYLGTPPSPATSPPCMCLACLFLPPCHLSASLLLLPSGGSPVGGGEDPLWAGHPRSTSAMRCPDGCQGHRHRPRAACFPTPH